VAIQFAFVTAAVGCGGDVIILVNVVLSAAIDPRNPIRFRIQKKFPVPHIYGVSINNNTHACATFLSIFALI